MCETSEPGERHFSRQELVSVNLDIGRRLLEAFGNRSVASIVLRLKSTSREVNAVINGEKLPSAELLLSVQRATGISIDWLLTGVGSKKIKRVIRKRRPIGDPAVSNRRYTFVFPKHG